ncbi:MAG: hypothetical protein Q8L24_01125 [bacterium]|nr:hypothetical protein [bacterium]
MDWPMIVYFVSLGVIVAIGLGCVLHNLFNVKTEPRNEGELSTQGCKLIGRGKYAFSMNGLRPGYLMIHLEEGDYCNVWGIERVPFPQGTMIRVYKNIRTERYQIIEDGKFTDDPFLAMKSAKPQT